MITKKGRSEAGRVFDLAAAMVQYGAVLSYPNADNFGQGVRAHEEARRYFRAMR
jgi:hypothetical protein